VGGLSPAEVVSEFLSSCVKFILALSEFLLAAGDFLSVLADLAPILANLFFVRPGLNIPAQLGPVARQLVAILLQLLLVFSQLLPRLANVSDVIANLAPAVEPASIEYAATVTVVAQIVIVPPPAIADEIGAARNLAAERPAIAGRRLMTRRSAGKPNSAPTRWRHMTGRNMKAGVAMAMIVLEAAMPVIIRQSGVSGNGQGAGEKPCCDGKFYVFHIDSFRIS
jgi:hypothetical protein